MWHGMPRCRIARELRESRTERDSALDAERTQGPVHSGEQCVLDDELKAQERGDANHGQPADVHLDIVEVYLVLDPLPLQHADGVEAEVTGAAVLFVLHAQEIAVVLALLQVVLRQRGGRDRSERRGWRGSDTSGLKRSGGCNWAS